VLLSGGTEWLLSGVCRRVFWQLAGVRLRLAPETAAPTRERSSGRGTAVTGGVVCRELLWHPRRSAASGFRRNAAQQPPGALPGKVNPALALLRSWGDWPRMSPGTAGRALL